MSRGPQRQPTEALKARGSTLAGSREGNQPQVMHCVPEPPFWLTCERKYWDAAVESVAHLRCVALSDREQLGLLADAMADYHAACLEVKNYGMVGESEKTGGTYLTGASNAKQQTYSRFKDCLDRFGMNPSNRSKVIALAEPKGEIHNLNEKKGGRFG